MPTPITPNQVSMMSILPAAAAGADFIWLPPVAAAVVGSACLFAWHVLDGADGDLARRTGRASASGELIDGVCDHVSQGLIYVALAIVLQRTAGVMAWGFALAAAISHTFQANAYEAGRKTYRRWVYGAVWMRQRPDISRSWAGLANRVYLAAARLSSPLEDDVEAAMIGGLGPSEADLRTSRQLYQSKMVGLVKSSSALGATSRSVGVVACVLAGRPLWFFLYEIAVLNAALVIFVLWRRRANLDVVQALGRLRAEL